MDKCAGLWISAEQTPSAQDYNSRVKYWPIAVVAVFVSLLPFGGVREANACSPGPDYNPVRDSDVIVGGRVTGWGCGT